MMKISKRRQGVGFPHKSRVVGKNFELNKRWGDVYQALKSFYYINKEPKHCRDILGTPEIIIFSEKKMYFTK